MKRFVRWTFTLALIAGTAGAQSVQIVAPRALARSADESNSARIGVFPGEYGIRDTLGMLVNSLVADGPAAKAGLKNGDRIQAVGGVNLKMARDDASDPVLNGMMLRRLTRELDKMKAGDEVELRVLSDGNTRTVRVKTVAARDLETMTTTRQGLGQVSFRIDDRAALGLGLGGSFTKRDTLGVFVVSVTPDGPAEKAGIIEGDRIARINGMDLRVPSEEAGDAELARARVRRFTQEVGKLKAGDAVTLSVTSGGRLRDVRLMAVKASELHSSDGMGRFFGDGSFPSIEMPSFRVLPRGGTIPEDIREQIQGAMEKARQSMDDARKQVEKIRIPVVRRSSVF